MTVKSTVDRLLEQGEEFDARAYLEKTPDEDFDEGTERLLKEARRMFNLLTRQGIVQIARGKTKAVGELSPSDVAQAVLSIVLEKNASPHARRAYLRIKRHARFIL